MAEQILANIPCHQCSCVKNKVSFIWISHKLKAVWLENPKAASTSVKRALEISTNDTVKGSLKDPHSFYRLPLPRDRVLDITDYFVFGFCRNPWDRMVSMWKNFTTDRDRIQLLRSRMGIPTPAAIKFPHFVRKIHAHKSKSVNHHWQPQSLFLPADKMCINYVGRFESLDESWSHVIQELGIHTTLGHQYATKHGHYSQYYNDEAIELVETMYQEDIDLFGYEYEEGDEDESV